MKVLLDTNVYVAFHRGQREVVRHVREAESVMMSMVVVGELLYGFRYGNRYQANLERLYAFLESPVVSSVDVTLNTAERFGLISASLRRKGRPIPTNDIWIAAHAFESNAQLLTFDHHFSEVDNLPRLVLPLAGETH